jgi:Flp pilus assembly protein TadD
MGPEPLQPPVRAQEYLDKVSSRWRETFRMVSDASSKQVRPWWAFVVFPYSLPIAGYLAQLRQQSHNLPMFNLDGRKLWPLEADESIPPVSLIVVPTPGMLRVLARESPLFENIRSALEDLSPQKQWLCFAEAPSSKFIAEQSVHNATLFRKYFPTRPQPPLPEIAHFTSPKTALLFATAIEAFEEQNAELTISTLSEIVKQETGWPALWSRLALAYHELKDRQDAIRCANKAMILAPDWILPMQIACAQFDPQDHPQELLWICPRILSLDRFHTWTWMRYGEALWRVGELKKAYLAIERACMLDESSARNWSVLTHVLLELKDYKLAVVAAQQGTVLAPTESGPLSDLGWALALVGEFERAQETIETALKRNPRSAAALDSMGYICMQTGRLDDAIAWFKKAIKAWPEDIEAWNHLAEAYLNSKQLELATVALDKATHFDCAKGREINGQQLLNFG